MTETQREAISSPATGLSIYQTDYNDVILLLAMVLNGSIWVINHQIMPIIYQLDGQLYNIIEGKRVVQQVERIHQGKGQ